MLQEMEYAMDSRLSGFIDKLRSMLKMMEEDPCDDNQVAMAKETSPTAQHRCRHMQAFVCMRMCPYMCAGAVDAMM